MTYVTQRLLILIILLSSGYSFVYSQTISHTDGTALITRYCFKDTAYGIAGAPSGGIFSGCGVTFEQDAWHFNPVKAAAGISVFPYQCVLTYTVNGQRVSRTILVQKPVVVYPPMQAVQTCTGSFQLHAGTLYAGYYEYRWSPAAPLDRADTSYASGHITATQMFRVAVTDRSSGCTEHDSMVVLLRPSPELTVSGTQTINARETVQLQASGALSYRWLPDTWLDDAQRPNPVATPQAPVTYTVVGANEYGCRDTASVSIHIREQLLVPNAFSPNGDGLNDRFALVNYGYQKVNVFRIFNRWGQLIFTTNDGTAGWDGRCDGAPADAGTYYYHIVLLARDNSVKTFRGAVQLIR